MSQGQLAEKMGVSINAVSKWERGLSFPAVSLFKSLCSELDISIEEFINGEKDNSKEAKDKAIITTFIEKEKVKKKNFLLVVIFLVVVVGLIIGSSLIYKNGEDKLIEYYERNHKMTFVARDVDAILKYRYDGEYPDYYGGMYISDDSYHLMVLIVKDKIPNKSSLEFYYYNELITLNDSIKIEYVENSYNDLEKVYNVVVDYISNNKMPDDFNSVSIDIKKNGGVVNYVEVDDKVKEDFRNKVIDSDLVEFEKTIDYVDNKNRCTDYPSFIGTDKLVNHGSLLMSVRVGNKQYVPVVLSLYDDGVYEVFTAYEDCRPGKICNAMLKYTKSIKGEYNYDISKILDVSTNANDMSYQYEGYNTYSMDELDNKQ